MISLKSTVVGAALGLGALLIPSAAAVNLPSYEYVIVGSGAGGGPLAARLAMAGHSTLLIEAGDDQGANYNVSVPAYQAKSTESPLLDWSFFVNHYQDTERQKLDYKLTYNTPGGGIYVGTSPPAGSTIKGILYPRSATLGGCTQHNALVSVYPDEDDFNNISALTNDPSWSAANMRKYFVKMENNQYLPKGTAGHGFNGWFYTSLAPISLALKDSYLFKMILGATTALGNYSHTIQNLGTVLAGDANADSAKRDSTQAVYQVPISADNGVRHSTRDFLLSVVNAKTSTGAQMYPLTIRTHCLATAVTFDKTKSPPVANGVNFLDGAYLYRASPLSSTAGPGVAGHVTATREVIVAGGSYNSPQLLKLSGIGPEAELQKFGIPVVANLPGVGTNLQDHYEVVVQGTMAHDFPVLKGCTFGFNNTESSDPCLKTWESGTDATSKGTYSSSGFAAAMFFKSTASPDGNYDELAFGGPVNFRGYFPGYSYNATSEHNWWSWALLKSHPRNQAGTVTLQSSDPRDVPAINFNYFDTGSGDYQADLTTITEAIQLARAAFSNQSTKYKEVLPGSNVQTTAQIEDYIKNTAWGHHCSCTCAIGADGDPMAVLDSSFRVRGVSGLRVVDASVYPRIPGTFTLISTYMVSEKAADVILSGLE